MCFKKFEMLYCADHEGKRKEILHHFLWRYCATYHV